MEVHLLAEAEDDSFHDSDLGPPVDENICLLSDTLEAMLVDDPVADHQGHVDAHSTSALLSTSEIEPMTERELLMSETNPVRLIADNGNGYLTSFSLRYNLVHLPYQHVLVATSYPR